MRQTRMISVLAVSLLANAATLVLAGDSCIAAKERAAGRAAKAKLQCHARAASRSVPVEQTCLDRAQSKLAAQLLKAERKGACPGSLSVLSTAIDDCVGEVVNEAAGSGKCSASKRSAAARDVAGELFCEATQESRATPDPACRDQQLAHLIANFADATQRGPCAGNALVTANLIDTRIDQILAAMQSVGCGNGVIDPGEQCDGDPFCSSSCTFDITACCQMFPVPNTVCLAVPLSPTSCLDGTAFIGETCVGQPCPGNPFPGCTLGSCQDQAISSSSLCCQIGTTCQGTSTATGSGLANAVLDCILLTGSPMVGTCGGNGQCTPQH